VLIMPIVARQSPSLPPSVLRFFWHGHGWFFDWHSYLLTYTIARLFVNSIVRSYQRGATTIGGRMLGACGANVIDRPLMLSIVRPQLSIARDYYRSPAIIIDRPRLFIDRPRLLSIVRPQLSIARDYYRSPATVIDRPRLLSIARHARSSEPLINNDNHARVGESTKGGLSHPSPLFDYHY
jgi:hypothetical protein